jgi:hypothetical protein
MAAVACGGGANSQSPGVTADGGGEGGGDASSNPGSDASNPSDGSGFEASSDAGDGSTDAATVMQFDSGYPNASLPALHVDGNAIKDPAGDTVILRGVAIPDIGALNLYGGGTSGVSSRIDEIIATSTPSLDSHVVRMPVYPETDFNAGYPYYSPQPYPVGTPAPSGTTVTLLSATDYINNVLKPAVDYATSKNLYVIIDFHQIDDVTSGTNGSSAAAVTFWTTVAPVFSSYSNVIYEAFNEPIDYTLNGWNTAFQTAAQSWVTAIRAGAPNNLIIVGSPSWSQHPEGAIAYPLTGGNLVFTAHIYPGNFPGSGNVFENHVKTAIAKVPVFISEWGYQIGSSTTDNLSTPDDTWATNLQTFVKGNGASWTGWIADSAWTPSMFATDGGLSDFGTFVQSWLANP